MRGIGFSLLAAALLASCGAKPSPDTPPRPAVSTKPAFLALKQQVKLQTASPPLRTILKITTAPNGDLYVLDTDHHRVVRFSADGALIRQAGGLGTGALQFNRPVDFDSDGLALWVLDRLNQRLVRLDLALNYVEQISLEPDNDDPTSALWYDAVTSAVSGEIILLDRAEPKAVRLTPSGDQVTSYGGFAQGTGRLDHPTALAASLEGDLYVADGTRVLRYDRTGNLRQTYDLAAPVIALAAGKRAGWAVVRDGTFYTLNADHAARAAIDPAAADMDPIAIDVNRAGELVVLDRELSVWLLAPDTP